METFVASEVEMMIKRFKIGDLFRAADMFIHELTMGHIGSLQW